MADYEMYDYLTTIAADVDITLTVKPQQVITEFGEKNQIVHTSDDGSETRISIGDDATWFYATLLFPVKAFTADVSTIFDLYHDTAKANGIVSSFKWTHVAEVGTDHTYVVRFDSSMVRTMARTGVHGIPSIKLRVLGRIVDA